MNYTNWTNLVVHEVIGIQSSPQAQLTLWCNDYSSWKAIRYPRFKPHICPIFFNQFTVIVVVVVLSVK